MLQGHESEVIPPQQFKQDPTTQSHAFAEENKEKHTHKRARGQYLSLELELGTSELKASPEMDSLTPSTPQQRRFPQCHLHEARF